MLNREQLSHGFASYLAALDFPTRPPGLYEPIAYALAEGGKRIRPLLTLTACEAFGGDVQAAMPAAAAVEVFHNFTLLHDDIMDHAPMRRGKPSIWRKWSVSGAILSGDAMMIYAYGLLGRLPATIQPRIFAAFGDMALAVCEGQQYDMDFERLRGVDEADYMEMIGLKTSALLAGATVIGAMTAGADESACQALHNFAWELGLAFQLQDDLLDSYGEARSLGKQVGGDILEGKKTYLTVTALALADNRQAARLLGLLDNREMLEEQRIAEVKALYDVLGVPGRVSEAIGKHFDRALEALEAPQLSGVQISSLRELALGLLGRDK